MPAPLLPKAKRITAASAGGTVARLAQGRDKGLRFDEKLEQLLAETRDPEILGHILGPYLAEEDPHEGTRAAIELLRAAGADETVAARNAAWQRERRERERRGGPRT